MCRHERDFESELGAALDFAFLRENLQFLFCALHMEDSRRLELVLEVQRPVFGLKSNMHIAKVKLLVQESAICLSHLTRASELFSFAVLNFKRENFIVNFGTIGIEHDLHLKT